MLRSVRAGVSGLLRRLRSILPRALLLLVSAGTALAVGEAALRTWAPASFVTIGHRFNPNASLYGWGYEAGERIVIADPDTGEVSVDRTNAAGWRDRDHERGRVPGVFRVLVLGDSVTAGAIVRLEDIYTRMLERALVRKGYAAEVISIALGSWGTDQELEALRLEGLSYAPDLVVVEFTPNDPGDIVVPMESGLKPFRYEIGPDGSLLRRSNPWFLELHKEELQDLGWRRFRDRFEILKRWALLTERLEGKQRPKGQPAPGPGRELEYVVADWSLLTLSREFGVAEGSDLAVWLRGKRGQPVSPQELRSRLQSTPLAPRSDEILRAFEKRWFQESWNWDRYDMRPPKKPKSYGLLFALLDEMVRLTREAGASFLLFSTLDQGHLDWDRYWFHIAGRPETFANYLGMNDRLRDWARSRGVDLLLPARPITRARNDPHPNQRGNQVMARALVRYIEGRYGAILPRQDGVPKQAVNEP